MASSSNGAARGTAKGAPVAVTGVGVVTSLGIGIADNWRKLTAGESGIRRISRKSVNRVRRFVLPSPSYIMFCVSR